MNVFEQIRKMVSKQFGISEDKITEDTRFIEDIEAKSLDLLEFVYDVEDAFDIVVEDDVIKSLKTVGQAAEYIENLNK